MAWWLYFCSGQLERRDYTGPAYLSFAFYEPNATVSYRVRYRTNAMSCWNRKAISVRIVGYWYLAACREASDNAR
jgi:hypothetical protein